MDHYLFHCAAAAILYTPVRFCLPAAWLRRLFYATTTAVSPLIFRVSRSCYTPVHFTPPLRVHLSHGYHTFTCIPRCGRRRRHWITPTCAAAVLRSPLHCALLPLHLRVMLPAPYHYYIAHAPNLWLHWDAFLPPPFPTHLSPNSPTTA